MLVKVYLGSDHAGFELKEGISKFLSSKGYSVHDFGTHSPVSCDYPKFIIPAARAVAKSKGKAMGIVFGGSGIGECIAANKVKGVRAAMAYDLFTAKVTREHNDSNVLCLGGRSVTGDLLLSKKIALTWLTTPFSGEERHVRRLREIEKYESTGYDMRKSP